MNTNISSPNLKQEVLEKIQSGEVSMKSRRYFIMKVVYMTILTIITALSLFILVSFLFFTLRISGQLFLIGFGFRGLEAFVALFPWVTFLITAILIYILERMLVRFRFIYHRPLIYLFLSTVFVISAVAYVINNTSFHGTLLEKAHKKDLPLFGEYYQGSSAVRHDRGLFRGVVVSVGPDSFVIDDDDDIPGMPDTITIIPPQGLSLRTLLQVGDRVFIGGDIASGSVRAYGIRRILPNDESYVK